MHLQSCLIYLGTNLEEGAESSPLYPFELVPSTVICLGSACFLLILIRNVCERLHVQLLD